MSPILSEDFHVDVLDIDRGAVVTVLGELDLATAPRLRQELVRLVERGVRLVTVDMSGLRFIDSTGLGVLVSALKRLRSYGGDLILRSPDQRALRSLTISGLLGMFTVT
jgi:anti-sigma B factor antagonist